MDTEWTVSVPLSALVALQALPEQVVRLRSETAQLRRELDALRGIQTATLSLVEDLRKVSVYGSDCLEDEPPPLPRIT